MDSIFLGALVAAVITAAAMTAYIAHSFEQSRQIKLQRLHELHAMVQEAEMFLYKIPSCYLPAEVRLCLIQLLLATYQGILDLDRKNIQAKQAIATLDTLRNTNYTHNPDPSKPVSSEVTIAKKTAELVKNMTNFLVRLNDQGVLKTVDAEQLVNQCKAMYLLVNTDIDLIAAKNIVNNGNPQIAALRYAKCSQNLNSIDSENEMPNRRQYIKECVNEVNEKIEAVRVLVEQMNVDKEPNDEWDEFAEKQKKDDQWQVKNSYDS